MTVKSKGLLLILSSPSGAGKTTISGRLLKLPAATNLVRSISVTTRLPRAGEIDGKDYFFVNKKKFHELCISGQMLEYAEVFGNFYGIPKNFIEHNINNGTSVILSIDWQGALHLRKIMGDKVISVFILPPSLQELKLRLKKRNSDTHSVISHRLMQAKEEMSKSYQYDYVIINNDINESVENIVHILNAEKLKVKRTINLREFISTIANTNHH